MVSNNANCFWKEALGNGHRLQGGRATKNGKSSVRNFLRPPPSIQGKTFCVPPPFKKLQDTSKLVVPSFSMAKTCSAPAPFCRGKTTLALPLPFCSPPPLVPPLQLLKGTHHLSELHKERVCFFKVCMSAIFEKRVCFWPRYPHFLDKGVYFLHIQQSLPQNSAFCRKN